jgi:hypothetical protein
MADGGHQLAVDGWLARVAAGRSVESVIQAFEQTFAALWQRSVVTLGEVTLTAIVDRVLHTAMEEYPVLGSIDASASASGVGWQGLRAHADLRPEQVFPALRSVLVEFLTVLGNLTAEILTSALHDELSKCGTTEDGAP